MKVSEIKTQVGRLIGFNPSDSVVAARMLDWINYTRMELNRRHDWSFTEKVYTLQTIADYTTGSINTVNGSATISGTGTAWSTNMIGRRININDDADYYIVNNVASTTSLNLDKPYIGTTATFADYTIRKLYYRLPGDAKKTSGYVQYSYPEQLSYSDHKIFNELFPSVETTGEPFEVTEFTRYGREDTYTTGTISITDDSKTITGSTTAFITNNIMPGDKLTVDGVDYYIDRVDSDTVLTLYQACATTHSGASYTVTTNPDSLMARFRSIPDSQQNIILHYYHQIFPLVQDDDEDIFLRQIPDIIVQGVYTKELQGADDNKYSLEKQVFEKNLLDIKISERRPGAWIPRRARKRTGWRDRWGNWVN